MAVVYPKYTLSKVARIQFNTLANSFKKNQLVSEVRKILTSSASSTVGIHVAPSAIFSRVLG